MPTCDFSKPICYHTVAYLELNVMVLDVNKSRNIVHIQAVVVVSSMSEVL